MTLLADLTWPDAERAAARASVLIVPLGATEQHGPHLPLDTDTTLATELAHRVAARLADAVVAPPLPYGASGEHQPFAGTLSIGLAALEHLLVELVRSAATSFRRTVLLSAHGGNAVALQRAQRRLLAEGREVLVCAPSLPGADAHAGRTETSLLLALDPARVRTQDARAGAREPLAVLLPAIRAGSVRDVSPNGVLGDPAGAGAAEGRQLLEQAAERIAGQVREWVGR